MSKGGSRTDCSDQVDATGRYIWRENGKKEGRCSGIDFEQADRKRRANQCTNDDIVCRNAAISLYVPFAYDAGIALAYGLHNLLHHEGFGQNKTHKRFDPNLITTDLLFPAVQKLAFDGVSGHVSFRNNGDRNADQFKYAVYNYHENTRGFEAVGQMLDGAFVAECEGGPCPSMVFSDGDSSIPVVRVRTKKPLLAGTTHTDLYLHSVHYDQFHTLY